MFKSCGPSASILGKSYYLKWASALVLRQGSGWLDFVRGATHANFVIQNHFVGVVHKALLDTKSRKETKEKRSNPAAPQPRSSVSHTTANGLLPWPS